MPHSGCGSPQFGFWLPARVSGSGMDLSDVYDCNEKCAVFSDCGNYIAYSMKNTVYIQGIYNPASTSAHDCADIIDEIKWSHDSSLILCAIKRKNCIQVFSVDDSPLGISIDCAPHFGLKSVFWAPNSRHILVLSEFSIRLTLWSLSGRVACVFEYIKSCSKPIAFSPDGHFVCVLERKETKDYLCIHDCGVTNWCKVLSSQLSGKNADATEWSPDGRYIVVYDSYLSSNMSLFNTEGTLVKSTNLSDLVANDDRQFRLGIKCISWAPSGQLLAVGMTNSTCLILNHANWLPLFELEHPLDRAINPSRGLAPYGTSENQSNKRCSRSQKVAIYVEKEKENERPPPNAVYPFPVRMEGNECYGISNSPYTVVSVKFDPKKACLQTGMAQCVFSPSGRYLVTRLEAAPHALWVWAVGLRVSLIALLSHVSPVTALQWDPRPLAPARLALSTAAGSVFLWSSIGCLSVVMKKASSKFPTKTVAWNKSGTTLLLQSTKSFCICSFNEDSRDCVCPLESAWTAPLTERDVLDSAVYDPQTPLGRGAFPGNIKADLPGWASSARHKARESGEKL